MKTTFSYFPGMFENPAPAVKTSFERNVDQKSYEIFTMNEYIKFNSIIISD